MWEGERRYHETGLFLRRGSICFPDIEYSHAFTASTENSWEFIWSTFRFHVNKKQNEIKTTGVQTFLSVCITISIE